MKNQKCEKEGLPRAIFGVLVSFWGQLGAQEGAQDVKKRLQEAPKKHLEKKVSRIIGQKLKKC